MHHAYAAPLISVACSLLAICVSAWNSYRIMRLLPARGRAAVAAELARRGETLVSIDRMPWSAVTATAGLCSTAVFRVVARAADGSSRTYDWAYESRVFPWQTAGLKRCAHGVWIALA